MLDTVSAVSSNKQTLKGTMSIKEQKKHLID